MHHRQLIVVRMILISCYCNCTVNELTASATEICAGENIISVISEAISVRASVNYFNWNTGEQMT